MSRSRGRARLRRKLRRWVKLGKTLVTKTIVIIVLITTVVAASRFWKRADTEKTKHGLRDIFNATHIVCLSLSHSLSLTLTYACTHTHTHTYTHTFSVCVSLSQKEEKMREELARGKSEEATNSTSPSKMSAVCTVCVREAIVWVCVCIRVCVCVRISHTWVGVYYNDFVFSSRRQVQLKESYRSSWKSLNGSKVISSVAKGMCVSEGKYLQTCIRAYGDNQNPLANVMWLKDLSKRRGELFRV